MQNVANFIVETFWGVAIAVAMILTVYIIYRCVRDRGSGKVMSEFRKTMTPSAKDPTQRDPFSENTTMRVAHPRPSRTCSNRWFCRETPVIRGFEEIYRRRNASSEEVHPYLLVFLLEYFLCIPFAGHIVCLIGSIIEARTGIEIPFFSGLYTVSHWGFAIFYAALEVILHIVGLNIQRQESALFSLLFNIKEFLCEKLGETNGEEAARFIALLVDMGLDDAGRIAVINFAIKNQEEGISGQSAIRYIFGLYEEKKNSADSSRILTMTEDGEKIYNAISEWV